MQYRSKLVQALLREDDAPPRGGGGGGRGGQKDAVRSASSARRTTPPRNSPPPAAHSASGVGSGWTCPTCSASVWASKSACFKCGARRGAAAGAAASPAAPAAVPAPAASTSEANADEFDDFDAESWDASQQELTDLSGNGRAGKLEAGAVTVGVQSGHGATIGVPYVSGTFQTKVVWDPDTIPTSFTICSVTRYSGASNAVKGRILQCGSELNWLHGHWKTRAGVAHYGSWIGSNLQPAHITSSTDWLVSCGRNVATTGAVSLISNGMAMATAAGGTGGCTLGINHNTGLPGEASDWQLSKVFVWDGHLSDADFAEVSQRLNDFLDEGNCRKCTSGQYSSTGGATHCASCEAGKYVNTAGATACIDSLAFLPLVGGVIAAAARPTVCLSIVSAIPEHSTPYIIAGTPAACTYWTALTPCRLTA